MGTKNQNNHSSPIRPNVLLVEDEPIVQRIHKVYLEKMHCNVEVTADSSDALLLSQKNYALIVIDIGLPNLNGIELAKEIRQREKSNMQSYTPIIAVTVYTPTEIQARCETAGIDEIAYKPVSFNEFQKLILRWLPINAVTAC